MGRRLLSSCLLNGMMCAATIEASISVNMQQSALGLSPAAKLFRVVVDVALEDVRTEKTSVSVA